MQSPSLSPSSLDSRAGTPALSGDMTSPSSTVPGSPSLASTTSLTNKRPLNDAYEDEGSPRVRLLEDDVSDRPVAVRLPDSEQDTDEEMFEWVGMPSTPPPPRHEQIAEIARLNAAMNEGETWFVVARSWWKRFENADLATEQVGAITNADILDSKGRLKPAGECEYVIVSQDAWKLLTAWYDPEGEIEGIARTTVNTSNSGKNIEVEIYPPTFKLHHLTQSLSDSKAVPSLIMSRTSKYSDLETAIKECLDITTSEIRIWRLNTPPASKLDVERFKLITDKAVIERKDESLQELGLGMDTDLVVECKSLLSGQWYSELKGGVGTHTMTFSPSSTMKPRTTRSTLQHASQRQYHQDDSRTKGTTGLNNLGNTCYMNSALQCLTHIEELTNYFLLDAYKDELNPQNPLGMDGKVATAYASLVHHIFGSKSAPASFVPRDIKNVIGRYGPMFSGYGQHDSQEFLAFLLDGLHEDLNRILRKPYTEKPELADDQVDSKEAVVELANKFWDLHLKRNDSIVQDLFAGMYKSTLVCPECKKVSITFDPYMDLTLPLPIDNTWSREVVFVPLKGRPVKVAVELNGGASVREYKAYVANIVHADPKKLVSASVYSNKFFSFHSDSELIADMVDSAEEAFLYAIDDVPDPAYSEVMLFPVVNKLEPDSSSRFSSAEIFGYPFLISLTKTEASSYAAIYGKLVEKYKGMSTNAALAKWGDDSETEDMGLDSPNRPHVFEVGAVSGYRRFQHSLHAIVNGFDRSTNVRERHEKELKLRQKRRAAVIAKRKPAVHDRHDEVVPVIGADDAPEHTAPLESDAQDYMLDAVADVPLPAAADMPVGDQDEQWLETSRGDSSDLEMQDVSDKESGADIADTPANGSDSGSDSSGLPSVSALFDEFKSKPTVMDPPPYDGDDDYDSSESESVLPFVTMGETLVCDWTREAYDSCFGATDDEDPIRGRPVWEIMETVVSDDVKRKRERKKSKHHAITLEDCLNLFSKPEVLGEDDLWYCPRCKKHQQAVKTFEIWRVPEIFTVHLKRFSSTSRRDKIDVKIDFPVDGLDLTGWVADPEQSQNPESLIYDLFAVDNHFGGLGGGHYTANVKNFVDGKWYDYDDASVRPITAESAVTSAAYMLFYRRRSREPLGGPRLRQLLARQDASASPVLEAPGDSSSILMSDKDSESSRSPPAYSDTSFVPSAEGTASPPISDVPVKFAGEGRTLGATHRITSSQSSTSWPMRAPNAARPFQFGLNFGPNQGAGVLDVVEGHTAPIDSGALGDDSETPLEDGDSESVDDIAQDDDVVEIKPELESDDGDGSVDDILLDGAEGT